MNTFKRFQRKAIVLFFFVLLLITRAHSQMTCTTYDIKPTLTLTATPSTPIYGQPTTLQANFTYDGTAAHSINNFDTSITLAGKGADQTFLAMMCILLKAHTG